MSGLQEVAASFRAAVEPYGALSVVRIDGLDRTGVPVVQANLLMDGKPITTGHGYGLEAVEAEVGALGELCEEVGNTTWLARVPRLAGSYQEMVRKRGAEGVIDPLTLCLPAGSAYGPSMTLSWVEGRCWGDGRPVLVPDEWAAAHGYDLPGRAGLITPITNGLGAGFDLEHAVAHGVMELLQRDGNVVEYRALDRGVVVELDAVEDPGVLALLGRLRELGISVSVKLASVEFGISNFYVVGDDPAPSLPIQVTACGEAAHPDRNRSLRKALLEFCGSRARKAGTHGPLDLIRSVMGEGHVAGQIAAVRPEEEEARALEAMVEWLGQDAGVLRSRLAGTVFSERERVAFSSLPDCGAEAVSGSGDRLALLAERLGREGMEIVVFDCTPPGSAVRAVKVVVPFLESETMSYGRIGWRGVARLRERGSPLVVDRPREGAARVRLRLEDEERAGGAAWFDVQGAEEIVASLYPLYREPGCFAAQIVRQRGMEVG